MRKKLITQGEITKRHPIGMTYVTDSDYTNFANVLLDVLRHAGVIDLSSNEYKEIAINLTLYYEDVMADIGIWRGFTDKVKELYGRYLPFYELKEDEYVRDEPNVEDVKFVIWNTFLTVRLPKGKLSNPETPVIARLAEVAYGLMDEWFEEIPINEELQNFFRKAKFMDDFYAQREVLKWLSYNCYLTSIIDSQKAIKDLVKKYSHLLKDKIDMHDEAECVLPYTQKTGPLALRAPEWLGLILRANGQKRKAIWTEQQDLKPLDIFKILESKEGQGVKLEDTKGDTFFVTDAGLCNPSHYAYESKVVFASFVKYRDKWFVSSDSAWGTFGVELFELTKSELTKIYPGMGIDYDDLMDNSGGSPFFYFKNYQDMTDFLVNEMGMPKDRLKLIYVPEKDKKEKALVVLNKKGEFFGLFGEKAEIFLKDVRNPYYEAEKAGKSNALFTALKLPSEALRYAMEHDMLPDAYLNSIYGKERGKALFRENYDFFSRAVRREEYS